MLLRVSSAQAGTDVTVSSITCSETEIGVSGEKALGSFAEAAVRRDEPALTVARRAVERELGLPALVDASAVIGNFERMVRIADGCGISLDDRMKVISFGLQEELDISHYASAANTESLTGLRRLMARLARPLVPLMIKRMQRKMTRKNTDTADG